MDVNTAQQRAFMTLSEDGLVDLFGAAGLLAVGFGWLYGFVALSAVGPAMMVALWTVARKRVTLPRIGHVELREDTQMRTSKALLWIGLVGSLVMGLVIYFNVTASEARNVTIEELVPALPTFLIAVMAFFGWLLLRTTRFLLYALGLLVSAAFVFAQGWEPYVGFFLGAILPVALGAYVFVTFLKRNPVVHGEAE